MGYLRNWYFKWKMSTAHLIIASLDKTLMDKKNERLPFGFSNAPPTRLSVTNRPSLLGLP
jgi:hypothetical protein